MRIPDYNLVFPFYRQARPFGKRDVSDQPRESIYFPPWYSVSESKFDFLSSLNRMGKYWMLLKLEPSNILIPVVESPVEYAYLWYLVNYGKQPISARIKNLDYSSLAEHIHIDTKRKVASLPVGSNHTTHDVGFAVEGLIGRFVTQTDLENLIPLANSIWPSVAESFNEIDLSKPPAVVKVSSPDSILAHLNDYLKSRSMTARVPLLLGSTAVAKSAVVAQAAKANGYRLLDYRTQFLDKLDVEGLVKRFEDEKGNFYSFNAPQETLLEATDGYLEYMQDLATSLESRLKDPDLTSEQQRVLEELLVDAKEKSKPVVLFFDEITRAPASIRKAFTTILNQKEFQGHKLSKARIVAATNYPIDVSEELQDAYLVEMIDDIATLDRFESIVVKPAEVFDRWRDYISADTGDGRTRFHEAVVTFCTDVEKAYDFSVVEKKAVEDPSAVSVTAFPNYRTWQYVSNHLKAVEAGKTSYNFNIISGLLGEGTVRDDFLLHIQKNYSDIHATLGNATARGTEKASDGMSAALEECVDSGVPFLMLGMSSYGKTTRLKILERQSQESGQPLHVIPINLALKDRTDVLGAPTAVPPHRHFSKRLEGVFPEDDPILSSARYVSKYKLPTQVTTFAPDLPLKNEISMALKSGKKVVLFFDELNRAEPAVMSSVFEAISDNRFMGLTWEPGQVSVVAAGNYGELHPDAGELDPAFSARFCIYRKDKLDETDVQGVLTYMKQNDYHPLVRKYLETMTSDQLIALFSKIESRTLDRAAPSLRAFSDLSKHLKQVKKQTFQGKAFNFAGVSEVMDRVWNTAKSPALLKNILKDSLIPDIKTILRQIPDNWAAFSEEYSIDLGDQKIPTKQFYNELKTAVDQLDVDLDTMSISPEEVNTYAQNLSEYISAIVRVNTRVKQDRNSSFSAILGPQEALPFGEFFNEHQGELILEIPDLVNEALIQTYVSTEISSIIDPAAFENKAVSTIVEFNDHFGDTASEGLYLALLLDICGSNVPEVGQAILSTGLQKDSVKAAILRIKKRENMESLLRSAGIIPDKTYMDKYFEQQKETGNV